MTQFLSSRRILLRPLLLLFLLLLLFSVPTLSLRNVLRGRFRFERTLTYASTTPLDLDDRIRQQMLELELEEERLISQLSDVRRRQEAISNVACSDMACDLELEDMGVPQTFASSLSRRASWLIGLLCFQSASSIILERSEVLLNNHPQIVFFLTMLVGAGGNAGNQASVKVIRTLARGEITTKRDQDWGEILKEERNMALSLGLILGSAGFIRAIISHTPLPESIAIATACALIVAISIVTGAALPLLLDKVGAGAQNASTSIQVIMDILGVLLTCGVSTLLLETHPFNQILGVVM